MKIRVFSKEEWLSLMPAVHRATFNKERAASEERCDYMLVVDIDGRFAGYTTVHQINASTVYWQFGGALPDFKNTRMVCQGYDLLIKEQAKAARKIFTRIENTNYRMLKLALSRGFIICGVRHDGNETLVELVKDLKGE